MECHVSSAAIPRRLPGSTSIYDGVFSGSAHKGRVSSMAEDYREVFAGGGGENASRASIPVLDVPCFHEGRLRVDVRRSSLDYLKIFGGVAEDGFAASYEEAVGPGAESKVGGRRVKAKKRSPSLVSSDGLDEPSVVQETSILSTNEAKRFNVSYSQSNVGSNGKSNGTVHVAQLADIPGYSVLVEENGLLKQGKVNMEQVIKGDVTSDSGGGVVKGVNCRNASSGVSVEIPAEQSSRKDFSRRRSSKGGSFSDGMLFDRCGFMAGKDSYEEVPSYSFSPSSFDKKSETNGRLSPRSVSEGVDGSYSPPDLGSPLDANSAAAASVTAVKIAIEKAQARIKAAKEIMEGKKVFDFKVRVKKKFDSEDAKGDKKPEKEYQNSKMLHQKVCDVDTQIHSIGGITMQDLAEAEFVTGKVGNRVNESTSETSNVVGPEENRVKTGVDCQKGEISKEEEEDLFEDARAEPYHPEKDELREVIVVKNENQSSEVPESNCDISSSRNSAAVVHAEAALDEAPCHEKTNPQLLTSSVGVKESEEQIIPFELAEDLNRSIGNTQVSYAVSDDFERVKKFAFHFHVTPFEKLPALKIFEPNINHESQQLMGYNLVSCATDLCFNNEDDWKDGDHLSDEVDSDMREDLGMTLGNDEVTEKQEQYCEVINGGEMQLDEPSTLEENSPEVPGASLGGNPENVVSEIYDPALPKKWNDQLAVDNIGDWRGESEFGENPNCKEGTSRETVLPDSNQMENLKTQPEIGDVTETVEVPTDIKARRRRWTLEAHNVSRLINALAANACEPNVHEQVTDTQRIYEHTEGQTADEIKDVIEKGDDDRILLETDSPESGDAECVSMGAPCDSIKEGENTDEPIKSINHTFRNEEINQGVDDDETFISEENIANIEEACVDFQPTDDEGSDFLSNNDFPAQGAELPPCSGPESEASVKESSSENGVEFSGDNLSFMDVTVMTLQQLEKQATQTAEVGTNADKVKENHHATQTTEEVGAEEGPESEVQVKGACGKNVEETKAKEKAREKERLAVDRAIHEARQRAYAEAKQRAERAAVEKATSESRQRGIAQAREKVGKSSTEPGNKADDQRSMNVKLKAERAAVERATAEARERAMEKALAEKLAAGDKDSKPGKKSHEQQHRSSGSSSNSRHLSTLDPTANCAESSKGDNSESSQRRKARLERHQRTAERAAKALAEKNKRDLLAQREQAERNRLAETLDSEIKRWSSGKHGNLRALLSTLQYILGPDSGWQPVTLTEIVTAAAVRKTYRKATLYVHPDKLQQRGASLQQKYICEKVFDLLKDAWNKFGAEER